MTMRIMIITLFGLVGFAAGGIICPPLATAQETIPQMAQQDNAKTGPGPQSDGLQDHRRLGQDKAALKEKRQALKEELMKLPPDQRKARIEQLRQEAKQKKEQTLQQRKDQFQNRWDKATPEQRAKFCSNVQQKCASGGGQFACDVAKTKCAGQ